ncbi:MAG: hypothetical protein PHV30_09730 [Candidatus Margulisbacteria bacterium]|nr:hypothetical protein [Candidatus Margulisiibacteriota bacterium]
MKKFLIIFLTFSIMFAADSLTWQRKGGVNYIIIPEITKGQSYDIPYPGLKKGQTVTFAVMGRGTGNLDVDAMLYDDTNTSLSSDTEVGPIAVVSHYFDADTPVSLKVTCSSGKGPLVIYAEESSRLTKILAGLIMK